MKKTTTILFLSLYFVLAIGMTVSKHICGGKITSVSILPIIPKENSCGCEDTSTPDDCCKTEIKSIQLNDEQIAVQLDQVSSPQTDINLWSDTSVEDLFSSNLIHTAVPASSPPESPPAYILNCTFLI